MNKPNFVKTPAQINQERREHNALYFVEEFGILYWKVKGKYLIYDRTFKKDCCGNLETCRFFYNLDILDEHMLATFDHKEVLSFVKHKNTNRG